MRLELNDSAYICFRDVDAYRPPIKFLESVVAEVAKSLKVKVDLGFEGNIDEDWIKFNYEEYLPEEKADAADQVAIAINKKFQMLKRDREGRIKR